jgi:hypothetical protein
VFTHLSQSTPYTAAQIQVLARFPLITIEKYMGPFPLQAGKGEEDNIAAVASAVKEINPKSKVLMYQNANYAYPHYRLYQLARRMNWLLVNTTTGKPYMHNVINPNCTNPEHCPETSVGYYDFTNPSVQAAWVKSCTSPSIDGCFVDGVGRSNLPPGNAGGKAVAFEAGRNATFTAIAQKALCIVNDKQYYDPVPPYAAAQGEFLETFSGSTAKWMKIMTETEDGHLVQAHTSSICHGDAKEGLADLIAFLMVARPYSYFGCSNWQDVPTWPAAYDQPLGAPLGPAVEDADGTWTRRFARGTNCSINFGKHTANCDWGK